MKSRLLSSTAVVLALLLGMVTVGFAQITDAASIDFQIKTYNRLFNATSEAALKTTSTGIDTVGRAMEVKYIWEATQDAPAGYNYIFYFPKGTVVEESARDSIRISYIGQSGTTTYDVTSANILTFNGNPLATYDATKVPSVTIHDPNYFATQKQYQVEFMGGVFVGKLLSNVNNQATGTRMRLAVNLGGTTYEDISSFYAVNDLAEGVAYNTAILGFIPDDEWSSADSVVIIDRFGNFVPDFGTTAHSGALADTLIISTATAGDFRDDADANSAGSPRTNGVVYYGGTARTDSTWVRLVSDIGVADDWASAATLSNTAIFNGLTGSDATVLLLGDRAGVAGVGLMFNPTATVDSVVFSFEVKGALTSQGTVLGVASDKVTTMMRDVYDDLATNAIGSLDLAYTGATTNYNGRALTGALTVTLLDVFGDPLTGTVQANTDSVEFYFTYVTTGAANAKSVVTATNTLLQQGGQITSNPVRTRPATRLYLPTGNANALKYTAITSGNRGFRLEEGNIAAGVITLSSSFYIGTTSHPIKDSVYLVAYAKKTPAVRDSVLLSVEPNVPWTWDIDTFKANLATAVAAGQVIKGATIPAELPIYALDTTFNRVSNLNLNEASTYLGTVAHTTTGLLPMLDFRINARDPLGYERVAALDSINLSPSWASDPAIAGAFTALVARDSSYLYGYDAVRADSSRLNFGSTGTTPLNLRLLYQGVNYLLSMKWNPGTAGGFAEGDMTEQTLDLGLFTLGAASLIDSVAAPIIANTAAEDTAGAVLTKKLSFVVPLGETINPNAADSIVTIKFVGMPAGAGLKSALAAADIMVSVDNVNFYPAIAAFQGGSGVDDSVSFVVPLYVDATTGSKTVYVNLAGFTNPTLADTAVYQVVVTTKASPVEAHTTFDVNTATYTQLQLVKKAAVPTKPQWLSQVTLAETANAWSGVDSLFQIVFADRFGNLVDVGAATKQMVISVPDTNELGKGVRVRQIFAGDSLATLDRALMDTVTVNPEIWGLAGDEVVVDSLMVKPYKTGTYTLKIWDRNQTTARDSITLVVGPTVAPTASAFTFVSKPEALVQDTTNAKTVVVDAIDLNGVKKTVLIAVIDTLKLNSSNIPVATGNTVTVRVDSLVYAGATPDTARLTASIGVKALASQVKYVVMLTDSTNVTTYSDTMQYVVAPKLGKQSLSPAATNVADLMRTVYLLLGAVTAPTMIDYLGLDLDQSGTFDTPDLTGVLTIWRGGTMLASMQDGKECQAKAEMSCGTCDNTSCTMTINLENTGNLNMGVFRIKYDTEKYILGDVVATNRLEGITVASHNDEVAGVYSIVVLNVEGRGIASGSGAILNIPVQAVGEKFDGAGEISLIAAEFEQNVRSELNGQALALKASLPKAFGLAQNFPNPFNPSTTISYDIPEGKEAQVVLNVYNMRGQLVRTLVDEVKSEGSYQVQWDGADNFGRRVSSGVYFYRIKAGDFSQTRKMVILK